MIALVVDLGAQQLRRAEAPRHRRLFLHPEDADAARSAHRRASCWRAWKSIIGVPAGTFKIKILYEEGNGGRYLPAIAWTFRRRLLGTNVGRWDYLGSLIEMWKDDPNGIFPDPQTIGMASPNMIAYQRYNALMMLMAGMKHGELTQGAPIGGMAAVMMYQPSDAYGRSRYNPVAMRAIVIDKLRERLLGLMFVPDEARQLTQSRSTIFSPAA